MHKLSQVNALIAGPDYIRFLYSLLSQYDNMYKFLNMLTIQSYINQQDLVIVVPHFVKSDFFHSLEVVYRVSETQLQVGDNSNCNILAAKGLVLHIYVSVILRWSLFMIITKYCREWVGRYIASNAIHHRPLNILEQHLLSSDIRKNIILWSYHKLCFSLNNISVRMWKQGEENGIRIHSGELSGHSGKTRRIRVEH